MAESRRLQKQLEREYFDMLDDGDYTDKERNRFLVRKEAVERHYLQEHGDFDYLYPSLNDPSFNIKIAQKQEFFDTRYEGKIDDVEAESNRMCDMEVELAPYQVFVRNFLSFQTPYNSLLLYHGLGSGKTCSAITVAEEMRDYLRQMGISKRIVVVASPNVQDNFRLQLFDERKLEEVDGLWNIRSCTGNKFIREINPMGMKGLTRDKVIAQIRRIINGAYLFVGYIEFSNIITKKSSVSSDIPEKRRQRVADARLRKFFDDRLIVIDEVHNIRMTDDNKDKRVAVSLMKLVKTAQNLRLLLLSATPMYNSYKEIAWLLNIMNINDRRATIELRDIFDADGNFVTGPDGAEVGKNVLMRKATGYVSFVRGENPYTFPYRVFPDEFAPEHTFTDRVYPELQLNGAEIVQGLQHINVYLNGIGGYQLGGYEYILANTLANPQADDALGLEGMEKLGYSIIQPPLEALNMVYPQDGVSLEAMSTSEDVNKDLLIGKNGLNGVMTYTTTTNPPSRFGFRYRPWVTEQYGRIFSPDKLGNYSAKIKGVCDIVMKSAGIVLVYSQYIDGGLVPMALALEEMGFTRHDKTSLFATPPREPLDSLTLEPRSAYTGSSFSPATYTMITGDKTLSPDNNAAVNILTSSGNSRGQAIKVILISRAGSEGIDFKNIRQMHILDPWYNMNRIEQILGRGVRTKSHCQLPFRERNVEIYLHATVLASDQEAVDLYLYRLAELKATQIGNVARVLKESSVDCLLNISQNNFTVEKMNQVVDQTLSTGQTIKYAVGDKPYSSTCDYMERCSYSCVPDVTITEDDTQFDTYSKSFIMMNTERIIQRIRQLFKNRYFYSKRDLIREVNVVRQYPLVQVYAALDRLVRDGSEFIADRYDRQGRLINIGEYYYFQPLEITDRRISVFDRSTPVAYKRETVDISLPSDVSETMVEKVEAADMDKVLLVTGVAGRRLIRSMQDDYKLAMEPSIVAKGDDNWYRFCSLTMARLRGRGIPEDVLSGFLVAHIVEMLLFADKLTVLGYVFGAAELTPFEELVKAYFSRFVMRAKSITAILLENNGAQQMLVEKGGDWVDAEPQDYKDMQAELTKYVVPQADMASVMGFIIGFKDRYMIFKVKDMTRRRHKGARCDQAGKTDTIKLLNKIMGEDVYTAQNVKDMVQMELCSLQEFLLRYFDSIRKDGKRWFMTPEEAIINNVQAIKIE